VKLTPGTGGGKPSKVYSGMSEFWRITTTLLIVLLVTGALAWYVVRRAEWAFVLPRYGVVLLGATLGLGLIASVFARTLGIEYAAIAAPLGAFGGAVMLAIVISAFLLVPVELGRLVSRLVTRLRARSEGGNAASAARSQAGDPSTGLDAPVHAQTREAVEEPARDVALVEPPRRQFLAQLATGGALSIGAGSALYGTLFGRRDYTVETVPIRLHKLPRALDGITIVQLSDLHVGTYVGERELAQALSLVRDAKADVVVLTGDLLDYDVSYAPLLARFTRKLQSVARYGVFAIPGNHDHYAGAAKVLQSLRDADTKVLLNRSVRIGQPGASFVLAGLDDVAGPRFSGPGPQLAQAFANAPDDLARVLLSHNPAFFPTSHTYSDLTLSGHTHGGQVTLFINPAKLVLRHGMIRGHYDFEGSQLYVNRGFGTAGPPARIGSPPEVTRLVLHT
jgi:uncharacterized protein